MWKLFLLFTLVPAAELFVLLQIGSVLGPTPTFLLLLASGLLGAALARREGAAVLRQLRDDLAQGLPPADHVVEGVLVLVGALLLITPGVLTDVVGLAILFPPLRRWLAPRVLAWIARRFDIRLELGAPRPGPGRQAAANPFASKFD